MSSFPVKMFRESTRSYVVLALFICDEERRRQIHRFREYFVEIQAFASIFEIIACIVVDLDCLCVVTTANLSQPWSRSYV